MGVYRLEDSALPQIQGTNYDLAIFACGYERRARSVAQLISPHHVRNVLVFSFADFRDAGDRLQNQQYFSTYWTKDIAEVNSREEERIYSGTSALLPAHGNIRILVDYSSMPRLWYASILNWARFGEHIGDIRIDFVYAVGEHREVAKPMVIDDIVCIPGCEGGPVPLAKAVAVFGLGFDGLPALCVLDRMEPDVVYAFLASPAAFEDYPERARQANKILIDDYARVTLELPLHSVESTFRMLGELIEPHRKEADITIVPMGPKPHVLAGMLLSLRYEEVACLRVTGRRSEPENVSTNGNFVCTTVEFRSSSKHGRVGV